jgi:hypothetical protein
VIELVTTPDSFPVWYTSYPILLKKHKKVEYKYCVLEGGICRAFEGRPEDDARAFTPIDVDTVIENKLSRIPRTIGDSEADLFDQLNIRVGSEGALVEQGLRDRTTSGALDRSSSSALGALANPSTSGDDFRLFLVCYHLPVRVSRTNNPDHPFKVSWTESLIAPSEMSISNERETIWVRHLSIYLSIYLRTRAPLHSTQILHLILIKTSLFAMQVGTVSVPGGCQSDAETDFISEALSRMNCMAVPLDPDTSRCVGQSP